MFADCLVFISFDFRITSCYHYYEVNFMQKIISGLKSLDKNTYKIIRYGLLFSGIVCLTAIGILLAYIVLGTNFFYHLGMILIKSSFTFAVEFIICGIVVDFIKKQGI